MASSLEDVHAQWLEQMVAMRTAIAELELSVHHHHHDGAFAYGHDTHLDDNDVLGTSSQDIWDITSDDYPEHSSSDVIDHVLPSQSGANAYGQQWLTQQCRAVAHSGSGLEADALTDQLMAMLASDSNGKLQACVTSISCLLMMHVRRRGAADDAR